MAIIENNPFGDLRGSAGSATFTKNSAGSILRFKKLQTIPATELQKSSQSKLRGVSKVWRNLSESQKYDWKIFASEVFRPLKTKSTKKYTGFQAFLACYVSCLQQQQHFDDYLCHSFPAGTDPTVYQFCPSFSWDVVFKSASNMIFSDVDVVFPITLDNQTGLMGYHAKEVNLFDSGFLEVYLFWQNIPSPGLASQEFRDPNMEYIQLKFYLSEKLKFVGQKPSNPYRALLSCVGILGLSSIYLVGSGSIKLTCNELNSIANKSIHLRENSIYHFSVVAAIRNGTQVLCDSMDVTVAHFLPPP